MWQVIRLQEEFFLPGEVILEQGSAVDQLYFVCHGALVSSSLNSQKPNSFTIPMSLIWNAFLFKILLKEMQRLQICN